MTAPPRFGAALVTSEDALARLAELAEKATPGGHALALSPLLVLSLIAELRTARAATPSPRENGWEELRREIEALPCLLSGEVGCTGEGQHDVNLSAVLAIVDRLAAARGEPERLAALEEFLAASDAVEEGVVDFTLHASAVERLRAARKALG